jgi:hypothetical protein
MTRVVPAGATLSVLAPGPAQTCSRKASSRSAEWRVSGGREEAVKYARMFFALECPFPWELMNPEENHG